MTEVNTKPGLGEGLMETGVEVRVTRKDVVETVVPMIGKAVRGGAEFVKDHPRETAVMLTTALGIIAMLAPEVAKAGGPPTPIPPNPNMTLEDIRKACEVIIPGKESAKEFVRILANGGNQAAGCG